MKKKCLGCGKIFEGKISICGDCFAVVENTRKDIILEKNLRKEKIILARRVIFVICGVGLVFYIYALTKVSILLFVHFDGMQNVVFLGQFMGETLVAYLCGMFLGKNSGQGMFRYLSDKSWYGLTRRQRIRNSLKGSFIGFFVPWLIPLFLLTLFHIATFKLLDLKTNYIAIKLSQLSLRGFSIGLMLHFLLATNWTPKLSK